ncbi:MAG: hypothetical protein ACKOXI_05270 [Candidatus Planktophila sp.]
MQLSLKIGRITLQSQQHVAVVYAIGDIGPGGGRVFYADVNGFNCGATFSATGSPDGGLCHYLEVAPNTWDGVTSDPDSRYALLTANTDIAGISNDSTPYNNALGIGLGYKNTIAIFNADNSTARGAGAARGYQGGGLSDWYIPTSAELNLLCQWARGVTQNVAVKCTGGNDNLIWDSGQGIFNGQSNPVSFGVSKPYWTSSESPSFSWVQYLNSSGNQDPNAKGDTNYVRPIRAY